MNKPTLVLGASINPSRYSNMAVKRLQSHGHTVYAIGIQNGFIDDTYIETAKIYGKTFHTVTLYLNPARQEEYYDYILTLKPERVIFNPGAENGNFMRMLEEKSIKVEESCTLVLLSINAF